MIEVTFALTLVLPVIVMNNFESIYLKSVTIKKILSKDQGLVFRL
jgi:hypothetical protein